MSISLATLTIGAIFYLLLLFIIAHATERDWLPRRLVRHPAVYVLSLGVYATTWSYYGSVGFAEQHGLGFITIYLGVALAFMLTPVLLLPLLKLARSHQLTSMADVIAFRFDSQAGGVLATLLMLTGSLPYIALQIRAVAESTQVLSGEASAGPIAIGFCIMVTVFAIIFGARHVTPREKHTGLVAAVAFESFVKIAALLIVAAVGLEMAFDGPSGLDQWLDANPQRLAHFYSAVGDASWGNLLFLAFAAAFLLPRQFHVIFVENLRPASLATASWAFPLLLLVLSAAVPVILWAGEVLRPGTAADYHVLGIAMLSESRALALVAYLGGISAASAMIIVSTLALSSMSLNHLLLPLARPTPRSNLYAALRWARRALIAAIIGAGYLFYLALERSEGLLVSWGLISFLAIAQFLPAIVGVLYWPRATRAGLMAGLLVGMTIWLFTVLLPALTTVSPVQIIGMDAARVQGIGHYASMTFWSVAANGFTFAIVSLLTRLDDRQMEAATACRDVSARMPRGKPLAASPTQFIDQLAPVLGRNAAAAEVGKALGDLGLVRSERRPEQLQDLRDQVERNLSGMMGPVLARLIVDERLRLDSDVRSAWALDLRFMEERVERSRSRFRGLAAELDQLRRYHRQILEDLPLGVVAITVTDRIVRWNPAMERLTGQSAALAIGRHIGELAPPWGEFLQAFLAESSAHAYKRSLQAEHDTRWLSLHKAAIGGGGADETGDRLLLVEDVTELQRLEDELTHSERLASIGRLAAGVAHEIGNPVTGIACLAQELQAPDGSEAEREECAEQILEQTRRISTIVQTLVGYAHAGRAEQPRHGRFRLADAVAEAVRVVELGRRARDLTLSPEVPQDIVVTADFQRMIQVFVNLLSNAVDACGPGGTVRISARNTRRHVQVKVIDDGPGIPPAIQDKILEPFFTTKAPGQGTGLGLPLVYNIIREFNGELRIRSRSGRQHGTEITITLPRTTPEEADATRYA